MQFPNPEMQRTFLEAFFGGNKDILDLPTTLSYVVQFAKFVIFDVQNN